MTTDTQFGYFSPARGLETERGQPRQACSCDGRCGCATASASVPNPQPTVVKFDLRQSPRLIGLTGHKGAGKDTVASMLSSFGYDRVAFADPLKGIARAIGWDGDKSERYPCPCCGMLQGRALLQVLGTEGVRQNIRDDAWLLAAEAELTKHDRVVVTDVRFLNEADFVRQHEGEMWRVIRPGHEGDDHASETEQDRIIVNRIIYNYGDLEALRQTVDEAMRSASAAR